MLLILMIILAVASQLTQPLPTLAACENSGLSNANNRPEQKASGYG